MSGGPARIAPSVLNADLGELEGDLRRLEAAGIEVLHLDVMDGVFVPVLTFGAPIAAAIHRRSSLLIEAHLMVSRPGDLVEAFREAGTRRLIVHGEADPHVHRLLQSIRAAGMEAGVALNPGTPPETLEYLMEELDLVLVMTVNPGWGGQSFLPGMLPKIRSVREMAVRLRPEGSKPLLIEVDGGMNPENIRACREAGADLFVVGSGIFRHPQGIEGAVPALAEATA